jgi:hypothetical protein
LPTFRFEPAARDRGRYLGRLVEPSPAPIPLPPTAESLRVLIGHAADQDPLPHTHHAIARWCADAARLWREAEESGDAIADPVALAVAEDVDAQFDLFLANSYMPEELNDLDVSHVQLPQAWFASWLAQLDAGPG